MGLPEPESTILLQLRLSYQAREIYTLLYAHQDVPLTMQEIRDLLGTSASRSSSTVGAVS